MGILDDLCSRVRSLSVVRELNTVIDVIKVFFNWKGQVNWFVHSLIVGFEVRGCDFLVSIEHMLKKIAARESEGDGVLVLQLLEVRFFNGVHDFILDVLIHCDHILVDSPPFIMLSLELVLVGCSGVWWDCGLYSRVMRVDPRRVHEGFANSRLHIYADVPMVCSSLWRWKVHRIGI